MTSRENEILRQENEALRRRLAEAEQVNEALTKGQIDAVVDAAHGVPLLLRQAQEALQASEARFRAVVASAPAAIVVALEGKIVLWNQGAERLFQYSQQEAMDQPVTMLIPEPYLTQHGEAVQRFHASGETDLPGKSYEAQALRKDGSQCPVQISLAVWQSAQGAFTSAIITDITEQRRLEETRRSTEERFSLVFRASPIPIAIVTASSEILEVNDRYVEFSGYPSEDLVGHRARALGMWAEPADRQRFVDAMSREGHVRNFEATFRRKSGETRNVLLSVESIELRDVAEPVRVFMFTDITERRRGTDRLRESEERYRSLFDASVDTIITTDEDGRIVGWNRSAERMFGYAAAEVIGQPATVIVPHGYRDRHRAGLDHVKSGGEPHVIGKTVELEGLRRDGSEFPLEFSLTAWTVASGRFYTAIIRDITERKRAEEALRENQARLDLALRSTQMGVWHWDLVEDRRHFDDQICRLLGVDAAAFTGKAEEFFGAVHPDDLESLKAALARTIEESVPYESEYRVVWPDGSVHFIAARGKLVRDESGWPLRINGIAWEITERKRGEEALRQSEERYRLFFEQDLAGHFISTTDGRVLACNPAFARIFGFSSPEEARKKNIGSLYPNPEVREKFLDRLRAEKRLERLELELRQTDGQTVHVVENAVGTFDDEGKLIEIRGYLIDETERYAAEREFRQAQKMEAVGRLAGGVAHDFNNLLTVIFGYSDVLLQGLEPGPLHEAMQEIRRASERAAALTRQLLAFSRKQTLVPEVLDMGDVVSGMSTMVERLIGEEVKVSVVVSPGLGRVKADRGQLEQVLMNLAVNARDAMPKGGSLTFELQNVELDDAYTATHAEVEPGPYVLLAISDTGTGMDAETQKRIFEPFFTTKETGKGTGLGLSTVHGIVHQSGGSIDVYSEPGRGTTFKVYLPRFAGDAAVPRSLSGIHPALPAGSGSETVLVVEDEAVIRQLTNLILKKAGYTVLLAESPVAAERIAGSHPGPIHLLLTDVVMPGMRGPELAERLLRLRPDLRVLYMSGYTDDAIAHHGFLDAGTEFLQKPFTPLRLMQKIREVLGRSEP